MDRYRAKILLLVMAMMFLSSLMTSCIYGAALGIPLSFDMPPIFQIVLATEVTGAVVSIIAAEILSR